MIEWVDVMLEQWGDFMRDSNNLGYPSTSVEYRMRNGCFGGGSVQAADGFMPDNVARTEAAVLTLPHELQAAVSVVYATTRTTKEEYARRLTRRLGQRISRDRLNRMLDQSHSRLAGVFDGMKLQRTW